MEYIKLKVSTLIAALIQLRIEYDFTEKGLIQLDKVLTQKFREGKIDESFFEKYFLNFFYLMGQTYIKENGGEWLVDSSLGDDKELPKIKCVNGQISKNFRGFYIDIMEEELVYNKNVLLQSPYWTLKNDCKEIDYDPYTVLG